LYSCSFHDRSHAPTGDNASSVRGGLENYIPGAKPASHLKRDGSFHDGNSNQVFLGLFQTLSYRFRYLISFTHSVTDNGVTITHDYQGAEAESTAPLYDLGHPADVNYLLLQLQTLWINPFQENLAS
jgi:hypothetical protein